jgi:hypothetical protein
MIITKIDNITLQSNRKKKSNFIKIQDSQKHHKKNKIFSYFLILKKKYPINLQ